MTRNKKILLFIAVPLVIAPYFALAANVATGIPYWPGVGGAPQLISCTGFLGGEKDAGGKPLSAKTPCVSLCDLIDTVLNVIYFAMTLAIFVFAPMLFAWGGFMVLTAGAKPDQVGMAKKVLTGTLIGVLIVLGSFLIIYTVAHELGVGLAGFTKALNCQPYKPPAATP